MSIIFLIFSVEHLNSVSGDICIYPVRSYANE